MLKRCMSIWTKALNGLMDQSFHLFGPENIPVFTHTLVLMVMSAKHSTADTDENVIIFEPISWQYIE